MDARDRKIKVGISIGDPNGVGIEIILKIFQDKRMFDFSLLFLRVRSF